MAFEGMDVDLANSQLQQLQNQGVQAVSDVIQQVSSLVTQIEANWKGTDASNFQSEWSGTLQPSLTNVLQHLTDFHTTFNGNIQQQISASAT